MHGIGKPIRTTKSTNCPSILTRSKEPKGYSHPHVPPQWIPMGNHRLEHRQFHVNTAPPIMLEATVVET